MENFASKGMECGVHEILGRRPYMEDRNAVHFDISAGRSAPVVHSFFGVFDGHGGDLTSSFLKERLASCITKQESFPDDIEQAMRAGLVKCDRELFELHPKIHDDGSTVVFAVITSSDKPEKIWVANSGDSRAVMGKLTPEGITVLPLSDDHKPSRPDEKTRVELAGGIVEQARVSRRFHLKIIVSIRFLDI
jgi:serine/threonine protein phosphatase PrpC